MTSAMSSLKSNGFWRVLYMVLLGQSVSFSMALMSFSSSLFANLGVDAPFTLAFLSYLALNLVFGSVLLYRRQKLNVIELESRLEKDRKEREEMQAQIEREVKLLEDMEARFNTQIGDLLNKVTNGGKPTSSSQS